MFGSMCTQVATGNINSCFLGVDNDYTFVVTCGMTAVPLEGEFKKNEVTVEESDHFEEVSSLPYKIDFNLPVVKVMCGDLFGGLLTADGQVFTWGSNMYGKLGIKNEQVCLV